MREDLESERRPVSGDVAARVASTLGALALRGCRAAGADRASYPLGDVAHVAAKFLRVSPYRSRRGTKGPVAHVYSRRSGSARLSIGLAAARSVLASVRCFPAGRSISSLDRRPVCQADSTFGAVSSENAGRGGGLSAPHVFPIRQRDGCVWLGCATLGYINIYSGECSGHCTWHRGGAGWRASRCRPRVD